MTRRRLRAVLAATAVTAALSTTTILTAPVPAASATTDPFAGNRGLRITGEQLQAEVRADEVAAFGRPAAESMARDRIGLRAVQTDYPQTTRTNRFTMLTRTQREFNSTFDPAKFGQFKQYIPSPEFADHIALLPTGKVLMFSFESVEDNPQKETAPTDVIGKQNAGRAYLWTPPANDTDPGEFKAVPPPVVDMPDGLDEPRPAPFFCAGHSYLPNGMVGVFGGNLGGNGGTGAKLALVFDPWTETWHREQDMSVGRWYPSVVTGADGRQTIMSGQSELGFGTPTPVIERFPAKGTDVPYARSAAPDGVALDRWKADAPYRMDYPHLFSLRDGRIYGFGRSSDQQFVFDPANETRSPLPNRPDGFPRLYGSAVALPNGTAGPDSVLVLGGNYKDPDTFKFSGGRWTKDKPRNLGRAQDDTLIFPDGNLFTVNGAVGIRDYGLGDYNPNVPDDRFRQVELRDADGNWTLGPKQRLPRGYHSNAVVLPDGRIMVTGDELQQIANNPDIKSGNNGTIEIYEPPYLHQGGPRPDIRTVPADPVGYDKAFRINTNSPTQAARAVLLAPITSTHSVDTSQRRLELKLVSRAGSQLVLQTPASSADAPPGWYMLFLLNDAGVPSVAKWIQLSPNA
ncbi:galactose oxidase early set domain-containing protein [Kitasatospora sp. NRRL B-11411]|uniref:galactose oxidase early set domain-containing protein n=1 Tax=Kitasatospora sp. NRRL B-11411 TaxID=1463822 RepID=UPI0004C3BD8B|nr:galactose oxidase early set domain-containing protein [Kitasatospora sp. NRRL B-11411]